MTDPLTAELAIQIKAEMGRQKLTYEALAELCGVQVSTLKSRMTSPHGLRIAHFSQIADALHVTPEELTRRAQQVVAA